MHFGPVQAAGGGFVFLLALLVAWLSYRLKQKNRQLRQALGELNRRTTEVPPPLAPEATPIFGTASQTSAIQVVGSEPDPLAYAFLWEHLGDKFLWKHLSEKEPQPIALADGDSSQFPRGMFDRAALEPLLEADRPFTGLVVLVGIDNRRNHRQDHPAQPFIEGLLGPADFACRNNDDQFLIVCPGLHGSEAQRRLNEISERLWNFQLRGQGSFSVLFSWGGIGSENEPLSKAIASADERMQQTRRSRVLLFRRKAG